MKTDLGGDKSEERLLLWERMKPSGPGRVSQGTEQVIDLEVMYRTDLKKKSRKQLEGSFWGQPMSQVKKKLFSMLMRVFQALPS